jgi:AcrR family transcriptional regulator
MRLAASRPWREVMMRDIAEAAGVDLAAMRREFSGKGAILAAFTRAVDDEVLAKVRKGAPDQPARDRLFEVVMSRFDALGPYKAGLKSIVEQRLPDAALLRSLMASQAWMLHAAGIGTEGLLGRARVAGLASVYASVFRTWIEDEDPGLARTMAALDRRLKRGEQMMGTLDEVCRAACSVATVLKPRPRAGKEPESAPSSEVPQGPPPQTV